VSLTEFYEARQALKDIMVPELVLRREFDALNDVPPAQPKKRKKHKAPEIVRHLVIPDTQIRPDVPDVHMEWIGQYIVDEFAGKPLTIIHLGDHWDMSSLSSYDRGKAQMEGRRVVADILAGNQAFDKLNWPLAAHNKASRKKWNPRRVFLHGNHEDRITRAVETTPQLEGLLSLELLNVAEWGWEVHPFKNVVVIDGVSYSHYFYNPNTGRPYSGANIETRLKTIGHSFTMGHQQGLKLGMVETTRSTHYGLVAGSCYLHDEEYKGPQGNSHWRGIVVCNQVEDGEYDPMPVSLDYLCRRYEGKRLDDFVASPVFADDAKAEGWA
jgi:hypothetical protein